MYSFFVLNIPFVIFFGTLLLNIAWDILSDIWEGKTKNICNIRTTDHMRSAKNCPRVGNRCFEIQVSPTIFGLRFWETHTYLRILKSTKSAEIRLKSRLIQLLFRVSPVLWSAISQNPESQVSKYQGPPICTNLLPVSMGSLLF